MQYNMEVNTDGHQGGKTWCPLGIHKTCFQSLLDSIREKAFGERMHHWICISFLQTLMPMFHNIWLVKPVVSRQCFKTISHATRVSCSPLRLSPSHCLTSL